MNTSDVKKILNWKQSQNQTRNSTLRRQRLVGLGKKKKRKSTNHKGIERNVIIKSRG